MKNEAQPVGAYSIRAFCEAFDVSRSTLYRLWSDGLGPRVMKPSGPRGKTLIPHSAAVEWQQSNEAEFDGEKGHRKVHK